MPILNVAHKKKKTVGICQSQQKSIIAYKSLRRSSVASYGRQSSAGQQRYQATHITQMDIKGTPAGLVSRSVAFRAGGPAPARGGSGWGLRRCASCVRSCARLRGAFVLCRRAPCWCVRCVSVVRAAPPRSGVCGSSWWCWSLSCVGRQLVRGVPKISSAAALRIALSNALSVPVQPRDINTCRIAPKSCMSCKVIRTRKVSINTGNPLCARRCPCAGRCVCMSCAVTCCHLQSVYLCLP